MMVEFDDCWLYAAVPNVRFILSSACCRSGEITTLGTTVLGMLFSIFQIPNHRHRDTSITAVSLWMSWAWPVASGRG